MASAQLEEVIVLGDAILLAKHYMIAFHFLWFWDYVITFKDEVNYAWRGKKSWVFFLFLLNRYCPLPYLIWAFFAHWWPGFTQEACDRTAFVGIAYYSFATLFAQIILTLRVYVVTGRNTILTAILVAVMVGQLAFGCYVWVVIHSLGAVVWPASGYDSYRLCLYNNSEAQIIAILSFSLVFDLLVFVTIIFVGHRTAGFTAAGIPSLLDRIVKDATMYFLVIFTSHLVVEGFLIFAPKTYHLLPSISNVIFIPVMCTRLMLSLKKAADNSGEFTRTTDLNSIVFAGGHTTMEYAMEVGVSTRRSRRRPDQTTVDLELADNRTGSTST